MIVNVDIQNEIKKKTALLSKHYNSVNIEDKDRIPGYATERKELFKKFTGVKSTTDM
jgi:hypothetical protein